MPVYRMTIVGRRKPILLKGETAAKARDALVTAALITAEEMADALGDGEKIWVPGTDLPADEPEPMPETKDQTKETVDKETLIAGPADPVPEKAAAGTKA